MLEQGGSIDRPGQSPAASDSDDEILHITAAEYLGDYRVWLRFSDGTCGEADLGDRLYGPVFEPLRNKALFSQVTFNPEADTIVWPNGADLRRNCFMTWSDTTFQCPSS